MTRSLQGSRSLRREVRSLSREDLLAVGESDDIVQAIYHGTFRNALFVDSRSSC